MNKSSKPTTLALITTLLGFSFTASTVAQEETETPRRESRIQQQNRYFHPDDLRLNSEFPEYLGSPFLWNQRSEFSESTSPRQDFERTRDQFPQHLLTTQDEQLSQDDLRLNGEFSEYLFSEYLGLPFLWNQRSKFSELTSPRQDSERTHDQYPQYLLPTQDEQRLQSVRTEERLRTEEGLRSLQLETDQGQVFGEGIVLQTEQRQQKREVTIEPRQTRLELATGNAQTEYFQQEQTEGFVAPRDNSSLIEGGTIVQQETVRQIQVTEGHQIDGQRVIEDHKLIEDQRLVEGQSRTQGQRVFESTKRLQQPLQLERQVTKQRVETRVQLGAQEFRGAAIDKQTSRREIGILDTEKIVSVSPTYTSNRFEKEERRATVVAPVQNTRGPQTRGQAAQRAIAQGTTRHSQRESQKAGAWWMFLTIVPIFCWAAWRFISSSKTEKQVTKTRPTTDQSTTRTLATAKTNKSQQRQSREKRSERSGQEDRTVRSESDRTEVKSRGRSEQTVRSESRSERPDREKQTVRSEVDQTNPETVTSTGECRDDLTRIQGITEEAQRALNSSGYYRFSDLRNANKKQLKRVLAENDLKFTAAQTKSWIVQSGSLVSQEESNEQSVQQSSQRDDLTKIRGIGKATSDLLSRSGITSYRDLYETGTQRLRQLFDQAGPKFESVDPSNWSQQASFAMNADWDGLKRWQAESAGTSSTQVDRDYSSMDPDDLTAIRGIGPAIQKILGEKGIRRFEQIASMKNEQFEELFAEHQKRFNLVDPSTWPEQAQTMLRDRPGYNELENEILNEIQSIAEMAKEQPRETRQSVNTPQS